MITPSVELIISVMGYDVAHKVAAVVT